MHFVTTPFLELDRSTLQELLSLTNSPERGDCDDTGRYCGSEFRFMLRDALRGYIARRTSHVVVARDHGPVLGWSMVTLMEPTAVKSPLKASIGFYVAHTYRRRGLAASLLHHARVAALDLGVCELFATPWNATSHSFFVAQGFEVRQHYAHDTSGDSTGHVVMPLLDPT